MVELFPEGFEEVDRAQGIELAAYTDAAGEERMWAFFGNGRAADVEDGWEDRWRAFHRPIRVGRLWVGPPWEPSDGEGIAVVIDPGRAFGTGSHQTTQLCLAALQELAPQALLDVGCGSGVLSVAAALLGFGPIVAVDVEPPSIDATRANAIANGVELDATRANAIANGVELDARLVGDRDPLPAAEVVVANISLAAVESLPRRIDCTTLVTSGYLIFETPVLPGFEHVARQTLDGWACDVSRAT